MASLGDVVTALDAILNVIQQVEDNEETYMTLCAMLKCSKPTLQVIHPVLDNDPSAQSSIQELRNVITDTQTCINDYKKARFSKIWSRESYRRHFTSLTVRLQFSITSLTLYAVLHNNPIVQTRDISSITNTLNEFENLKVTTINDTTMILDEKEQKIETTINDATMIPDEKEQKIETKTNDTAMIPDEKEQKTDFTAEVKKRKVNPATVTEDKEQKLIKIISQDYPRHALIIGNNDYQYVPSLRHCDEDAANMQKALQILGFKCILQCNLKQNEMQSTISNFIDNLPDKSIAFFYFAGHGVHNSANVSFILPIDIKTDDLDNQSLDENKSFCAKKIIQDIDRKAPHGVCIGVFDACRSVTKDVINTLQLSPGINNIMVEGTFLAYSCEERKVSFEGEYGLYTHCLLQNIFRYEDIGVVFRGANYYLEHHYLNTGISPQRSRYTDAMRTPGQLYLNAKPIMPNNHDIDFTMSFSHVICHPESKGYFRWGSNIPNKRDLNYRTIHINDRVIICNTREGWYQLVDEKSDVYIRKQYTAIVDGQELNVPGGYIWSTDETKNTEDYKVIKYDRYGSEITETIDSRVQVLNSRTYLDKAGGYWVRVRLPTQDNFEGYIHSSKMPLHLRQTILPYHVWDY